MTSGLRPLLVALLLLLLLVLPGSSAAASCPSVCLCLSDTVSCSSSGLAKLPQSLPSFSVTLDLSHNHLTWLPPASFRRMPRLENLRVAHNQLGSLAEGVFRNASGLRRLDLSSNRLRAVERHYFRGLWRLEELLLFDNRIAQVEGGALSGLSSLQRAYFSVNRITDFPFFSIRDRTHPFLRMLDLSSNRMSRLPWDDVKALPGLVQRGLYLHNNSLVCDCAMYGVFWHWELRGFAALRDFADAHTCAVRGNPRSSVRFLRHSRLFRNCSAEKPVSLPVTVLLSQVAVAEGQRVRLDCQTSLSGGGGGAELSFTWLSPSRGPLTRGAGVNDTPVSLFANGTISLFANGTPVSRVFANGTPVSRVFANVAPVSLFADGTISLFANGTLEIGAAEVNDSGVYVCTAADVKRALNATREVNVTVLPPPPPDSFNTGYTTLLGCAVTTAGVLAYLYMTPCRCCGGGCCERPGPPAAIPTATYDDPGSLTPVFSHSVREHYKVHTSKHVAFREPTRSEEGTEWAPES